jgi:hypothetical protein
MHPKFLCEGAQVSSGVDQRFNVELASRSIDDEMKMFEGRADHSEKSAA